LSTNKPPKVELQASFKKGARFFFEVL